MEGRSPLIDDPRTRELRSLVQEEMGGIRTILIGAVALAAIAGLVLGAIAVAYITGSLVILSGDVIGPFNRNQLNPLYSQVNCTDDEAAFGFQSSTKGLVNNVTCRVPNATSGDNCCNVSTLGGGASGPSDNNTLNILGTPNRVTVSKSATNVVTLSGPQDLGTASGPTFSAVFTTGSGVWYPNPGIGGGLEALNTYKGSVGGSFSANVTVGGVQDPGLITMVASIVGPSVIGYVTFVHASANPGPNAVLFSVILPYLVPTQSGGIRVPMQFFTGASSQEIGYMTIDTTGFGTITTISGNFTSLGVSIINACFSYRRTGS